MLSRQLGTVNYLNEREERELLALKDKWGFADPRNTDDYKNCDICANDIFRESWEAAGVQRKAFDAPPPMGGAGKQPAAAVASAPAASAATAAPSASGGNSGLDEERLIQLITDQVIARLKG
jgi:L-fuculose-phosphate aldolase